MSLPQSGHDLNAPPGIGGLVVIVHLLVRTTLPLADISISQE
jgi:hypothetical protein